MTQSSHYVIARRLRENFRSQVMRPCREAIRTGQSITPALLDEACYNAKKKLEHGMRTLTHVPGCEERWPQWFETCFAYVQWWIGRVSEQFLVHGMPGFRLTCKLCVCVRRKQASRLRNLRQSMNESLPRRMRDSWQRQGDIRFRVSLATMTESWTAL
jgi:hypothetical protein